VSNGTLCICMLMSSAVIHSDRAQCAQQKSLMSTGWLHHHCSLLTQ